MGLFDFISGQFIEVIEWTDPTNDTLVYRFPVQNREIKMGAQLTVREGQTAVFINEGRIADVFEPGRHTLSTQNLPVLTKLKSWKYGFDSPFKAEVYFVSARIFTDQKWGTPNPIMMRDADFGVVRIRAFGTFSYRVSDPEKFLKDIVGTDGQFTLDEINGQLKSMLVSGFTNHLGAAKIAALDLAAHYDTLGKQLQHALVGDFKDHGLELVKLVIENVSLPKEVEAMLDKRTSMGVVGNLGQYAQFEMAQGLGKGGSGAGMANMAAQLGAGLAMGNQMTQGMASAPSQVSPQVGAGGPPPLPAEERFHYAGPDGQTSELTPAQIASRVRGAPDGRHLVWKEGMPSWASAADVPEIKAALGKLPPPIPGGPPPLPQ